MDVVTILLQPVQEDLLCKVAPQSISHNVCFLLKSSLLKSENDWKSDDMGAWKNNGVQYHKFFLNEDGELHHLGKNEGGDNGEEGTTYNIKRVYFKNKQSTDLKKCVTFIEGMIGIFCNITFPNSVNSFSHSRIEYFQRAAPPKESSLQTKRCKFQKPRRRLNE